MSALALGLVLAGTNPGVPDGKSGACLYTRDGISGLSHAADTLGVTPSCTLVFGGGVTWASWSKPWFVHSAIANNDWSQWVTDSPVRRLVITQDLIPSDERSDPNWRALGARGAFEPYARQFARTLVAAGLGNSYVRLGNEPNGDWVADGIGSTPADWAMWISFWRRTVIAMRSVPGAQFRFVWCVAPGYGDVPLASYYPGNDVVNDIGFDVYDDGFSFAGSDRWGYLLQRRGGIGELLRFATLNRRPVAVPEWGLAPSGLGGGDDAGFVRGIAALARKPGLVFQSYFDAGSSAGVLAGAPESLKVYRSAF